MSSTSVDQEWPLHKLDLVDCERFLHRRAGGCLRSSELAISKKQFTQTMSEHLSEQQLRVADSKRPAGKIETSLSGEQCGTRNRSGSKPPLRPKKRRDRTVVRFAKKKKTYGTGDGCQGKATSESAAASGPSEPCARHAEKKKTLSAIIPCQDQRRKQRRDSLKTPPENCKSPSQWPVPSLPVPDPQITCNVTVSTIASCAKPSQHQKIMLSTHRAEPWRTCRASCEHRLDSIVMNGLIAGGARR